MLAQWGMQPFRFVGCYLMFDLETIVLGFFLFLVDAEQGLDVTYLMDDLIVGDASRGGGAGGAA